MTGPAGGQSLDRGGVEELPGCLPRLNPVFSRDRVLAAPCHRYDFAQTMRPPGLHDLPPAMHTPVAGLFMGDTPYYYPEDRSISESSQIARRLDEVALCQRCMA